MKTSHKFFISIALMFVVLYLGGWRLVTASNSEHAKVSKAWEIALYDEATRISDNFVANGELNVYIYKTNARHFIGIMNIKSKNHGDFSMILALLVLAIPFGIFII